MPASNRRIGVEPTGDITPRESGLTSLWCSVTREPWPTDLGSKQTCRRQQCLLVRLPGLPPTGTPPTGKRSTAMSVGSRRVS